jgi:NCS2 family nucleobase:cation symporter-2
LKDQLCLRIIIFVFQKTKAVFCSVLIFAKMSTTVDASINSPEPVEISPEQLEREAQLREEMEERQLPTCYDKWIGDYKYGLFCKPRFNPWSKKKEDQVGMPFFSRDAKLPYIVALLMGFQHSLAVIGGAIVPGTLIGSLDPSGEAGNYIVSYSLIMSGICTWIQVLHTPIPRTKYFLGSGLLCVIAVSFAFLNTIMQSIINQMDRGVDFDTAYGNLIGTFLVGAVCQSGIGFIPGHILQKILPPWISGLAVFLIGVSLVGVGVEAWGGGTNW